MQHKAGYNVSDEETQISDAISFFAAMDEMEFRIWRSSARNYAIQQVDIASIKEQYKKMFAGTKDLNWNAVVRN